MKSILSIALLMALLTGCGDKKVPTEEVNRIAIMFDSIRKSHSKSYIQAPFIRSVLCDSCWVKFGPDGMDATDTFIIYATGISEGGMMDTTNHKHNSK